MKLYMWEQLDKVTDQWHSGGGLVVVAENETQMRELVAAEPAVSLMENVFERPEGSDRHIKTGEREVAPLVFELAGSTYEAKVYVFEDAGCC